jgi:hypothetical protein
MTILDSRAMGFPRSRQGALSPNTTPKAAGFSGSLIDPSKPGKAGFRPYDSWWRPMEISPATARRWREKGWITTTKIGGRLFVHEDEIKRFERRAQAGEFAGGGVA